MIFTASSLSSKTSATREESLSKPNVSCVISFEPIDIPSKYFKNESAKRAFDGSSDIIIIFSPSLPLFKPFNSSKLITSLASFNVLINGIISWTFFKPISFLTFLNASHSN